MTLTARVPRLRTRFVGRAFETNVKHGVDFDEMLESFIRSRRTATAGATKTCSDRTIYEYKYDLKRFFSFLTDRGLKYWGSVSKEDIDAFVHKVMSQEDVKPATKNKSMRSLRALLYWCQRQEMKTFLLSLPKIPRNQPRLYVPTPDVMQKFLKGFDRDYIWGLRDYTVTCILIDCGPRIGEICNLKPEDMNLDGGSMILTGKTGKRTVFIDRDLTVPTIKRWLKERDKRAKCDRVFISRYGAECDPGMFDQSFDDNRKRTGVGITSEGNLTPHTVRHYFATYYLLNGGSLQNLKAILGHTSYDTLQIYVNMAHHLRNISEEHSRVSPLKSLNANASDITAPTKKRRKLC